MRKSSRTFRTALHPKNRVTDWQAEMGPPSRFALRWTTFAWLANRSSLECWQA